MARVTIKELQEQLKKCDNIINGQSKKILELQDENENILNNKGSVSKDQYKALSKQFDSLQDDYRILKELYQHEKDRNGMLVSKCIRLEKELEKLKPKHNERGAGRKRTITDEQLEKINGLHKQGLSYGAIAKEVGFSKAYVYKLISERKKE